MANAFRLLNTIYQATLAFVHCTWPVLIPVLILSEFAMFNSIFQSLLAPKLLAMKRKCSSLYSRENVCESSLLFEDFQLNYFLLFGKSIQNSAKIREGVGCFFAKVFIKNRKTYLRFNAPSTNNLSVSQFASLPYNEGHDLT
jgi:hypothetical protein